MQEVCFAINSLCNSGGTERIAVDLANSLVKHDFKVSFIVLTTNKESFYTLDPKIKVHAITGSYLKQIRLIDNWIKQNKPNVIINVAIQLSLFTISAIWKKNVKIITWEHFFFKAGSFKGRLMRLFSSLASHKQIVLTEDDKKNYPLIFQCKIKVIPNYSTLNSNKIRSALDSNIAIAIGRFVDSKGFDLLIKAWCKINKSNKDWKLLIIGSGSEEKKLQADIDRLEMGDSIELLPPTKSIVDYYLKASVFILSSRFEPFGLVLIEAKSFGLPIISFNCPYGPKNIINHNKDGILVRNGDVNQLGKEIDSLLQDRDKIKKLGKYSFDNYHRCWSEEIILSEWLELINIP